MKVEDVLWDFRNIEHIARHKVTPGEVEEVLFENKPHFRRHGEIYYAFGCTQSGRYLFIVFRLIAPKKARIITARDMTIRERRYYRKVMRK